MSEDFSDDFMVEEEEEETGNRSFLIIAGSLIGVFILLAACVLTYVWTQRDDAQDDEVAQRISQNETTVAENALVTQTVQALQIAESENATVVAEAEAVAELEAEAEAEMIVLTAEAEETQAAQDAQAVQATREAEAQASPETESTSPVEQVETPTLAATGDSGVGTGDGPTATPMAVAPEAGGETLPETGVSAWGFVILAVGMLFLLLLARRLRTS